MENGVYRVKIKGTTKVFPEGTTLKEVADQCQEAYKFPVVLAFVDGKLQELHKRLTKDCEIRFETIADSLGYNAYQRSLCLLMVKAIHDLDQHTYRHKVRIHYSISGGYYCTLTNQETCEKDFLEKVEARMRELVKMNLPIEKTSVHTDEAISRFRRYRMFDKERLFRYRRVSRVNLYRINEFEDYYYGYMVPETGILTQFRLQAYEEGFVLLFPVKSSPDRVAQFQPPRKLFQVMQESTRWGDMQGIETAADLNDAVTGGHTREMILVQEALQEKKIAELAERISKDGKKKIILIAGPSSSGKTTFSHRLSIQLRANGRKPHPIAADNYFVEREDTPKDENGEYDYECLEALDLELFSRQMQELLEGREVDLPTFNFKTGKKEYGLQKKKLQKNDVLIIEGIHCLNPKMTQHMPKDAQFKIYISALTQLNIDEHNRIPTTDGRLIRRIVRDARVRGASAQKTIAMWDSVRRGEEAYIFPYQEQADVMFNSALIYEIAILKPYVEANLFGIDRQSPEYLEAKRLLKFMDYFVGIGSENVPDNSLLREFIGGGCFSVT